ncbi:PaaI family thioesterase [Propionivibrio limicola]|uniref:PaaI family thioesterase n=1 Tax=Propionivibrio limicola TaxID=167645 RepID=UPI001291BF05|nr:PaaI family thioesterase [Propionivibrio limicola]
MTLIDPVTPPKSHDSCMVCGLNQSLGLQFRPSGENAVAATIQASSQWQGYAGVVHGGMVSTLLDAAMTHCLFQQGVEAMTASLKVRFFEPVPCTEQLEITATLTRQRRHVYFLNAELTSAGQPLAIAEASFIRAKK